MFKIIERIIFWLITTIITFLAGSIYNHYHKIKKIEKTEYKNIKYGLLLLLKSEIFKTYERCIKNGKCSIYEIELLEDIYKNYAQLGGNGCARKLINKIKLLPITPID